MTVRRGISKRSHEKTGDCEQSISMSVLGGVVVVSSAYGLYRCYVHQKEQPQDKTSLRDETASEISEKKVLVLGIEGSGKSTFLAALAQHDSPITSAEREGTTPTEGFHVVCVSTEGVSLNVWESKYHNIPDYIGAKLKTMRSYVQKSPVYW